MGRLAELRRWHGRRGASAPGSFFAIILLVSAPLATGVSAQVEPSPAASAVRDRPPGEGGDTVLRGGPVADGVLRLDGRLEERAWMEADSLSDLRQREPRSGAPASERTVVHVLHGSNALYVGIRAYDATPRVVRASELRRDADLTVDDYVTLLIDSFRDHRGAFLFRTNPNGAMWDAQLTGFEDVNEDWNGIWDVATSRDAAGWTAEFRIPYRTLRFHPGETVFGFNVQRFIRRKNEEALWRSWGRTEGLLQLLNEGEIAGLGPLRRRHDVDVWPYGLTQAETPQYDLAGETQVPGDFSVKAGLDAKTAVLPTLTADLTINPDFAQVEADTEVINLTRFPVFFPEKREFFLESSGLFTFGTPERAQLFYSRRIGLDTAGVPVTILGGIRMYGKAGPWAIGAIDARTGKGEEANDLILRVKHDLLQRAYVGGILREPVRTRLAARCGTRSRTGCRSTLGDRRPQSGAVVLARRDADPRHPGHPQGMACGNGLPQRPVRQLRLPVPHRRGLYSDARLRAADGYLGDDGAHRLHAQAAGARHPAARHRATELGYHRRPNRIHPS